MDFGELPGGRVIEQGLRDLADGRETDEALLVQIGAPRLRQLGLDVKPGPEDRRVEHLLYARLAAREGNGAHSRYNALIRLLASFERAAACAR